jgi:hypothetical protein
VFIGDNLSGSHQPAGVLYVYMPREEMFDRKSSTAEMASSNVMVFIGICKSVGYLSFFFPEKNLSNIR